ncbi:AAA family ATPase [Tabrizicola sp.]|uniref:AAA family ATPase n=1 Tax=Tabrizicola sp. TaxID=2005166 RepID=UPI001A479818|nr:AAA family ATPase [Tabrizicola sp.]MBL9061711.1 AAA family ATPase [Tabrizicola sp.]
MTLDYDASWLRELKLAPPVDDDDGCPPPLPDEAYATEAAGNVMRFPSGERAEQIVDKPKLRVWSYDDMLALDDPEWLIEGVLARKSSALLFGKSNAFKTFLSIDMACAVATGSSWQGTTAGKPSRVIYVATEGSRGVAKQRIPGWMDAHQIPQALRRNIVVIPDEVMLDRPDWVDALIEVGRGLPELPTLVLVDIFGASMSGPETVHETATAWVRNVNRIMRELGCAVLTVAHTGWADETRARMHTHFWGSFDTRLKAEGVKHNLTTILTVDRHKDADSNGKWGFRLDVVDTPSGGTTLVPRLDGDVDAKPNARRPRGSQKPDVAMQALSEALIENGRIISSPNYPTRPVVSLSDWKVMCGRHGITASDNPAALKKAFDRAVEKLMDDGLVRQFDSYVWKVNDDG